MLAQGATAVAVLSEASRPTVLNPANQREAQDRPNIVFIFADDWGYGDLGIHGSTFCQTPRLDQMAAEGIDFQNFTVNHSVCSPSRTAVMTGQFPARHSVHQHFATLEHHLRAGMPDWLNPDAPMLPRMLQEAGYATAHFGKWHLSNNFVRDAPLPPTYGYDEYGAFNLPGNAPEQMPTSATCPRAVDFIRRHQNQPFFINLWIHETHTPHYPLPKYLEQFESLDEQKQVYAAIVAEGDAGVGLVLDTLKELGIDKNTLVIFSSDNGPEWTSKNRELGDLSTGKGLGTFYSVGETAGLKGKKRSIYAGGVRVPFIARWPGVIPAGQVDRDSVITAVDLLPTFLKFAGVPPPQGYQGDGIDISAALLGEAFRREKPIFWEWAPATNNPILWPHYGIRSGKWKLLVNEKLGKAELYDIESDWAESQDVSSEHPELVDQLSNQIMLWATTLPSEPPANCFSKARESFQ